MAIENPSSAACRQCPAAAKGSVARRPSAFSAHGAQGPVPFESAVEERRRAGLVFRAAVAVGEHQAEVDDGLGVAERDRSTPAANRSRGRGRRGGSTTQAGRRPPITRGRWRRPNARAAAPRRRHGDMGSALAERARRCPSRPICSQPGRSSSFGRRHRSMRTGRTGIDGVEI